MGTHVLLVDNNRARLNKRREDVTVAGIEVISAFDEQQAAEALKSAPVDVICIDSQFVRNCGPGIGECIERRLPGITTVLIVDDARIPPQLERYVDIVVQREDFPTIGKRLMQELACGHVPFFERWFCEWVNRASQASRYEAVSAC
jgi:DNA-binding NtrC family response regulator